PPSPRPPNSLPRPPHTATTANRCPPPGPPPYRWLPVPSGHVTYTKRPSPVPEPKEFNVYILVFPAGSGIRPIYVYLKDDPRKLPGVVTGHGVPLSPGTR
ncbi:S-type pyocin domain-containing protein, partial [Escherichia coli]|uniref:S-type pyocin domain-containing protein n=1 Tax=Escherichia coli TaxID=562 RepID=UPI001BAEEF20